MAFIDDYTAWTIGESAVSNRQRIEELIYRAEAWERRQRRHLRGRQNLDHPLHKTPGKKETTARS